MTTRSISIIAGVAINIACVQHLPRLLAFLCMACRRLGSLQPSHSLLPSIRPIPCATVLTGTTVIFCESPPVSANPRAPIPKGPMMLTSKPRATRPSLHGAGDCRAKMLPSFVFSAGGAVETPTRRYWQRGAPAHLACRCGHAAPSARHCFSECPLFADLRCQLGREYSSRRELYTSEEL